MTAIDFDPKRSQINAEEISQVLGVPAGRSYHRAHGVSAGLRKACPGKWLDLLEGSHRRLHSQVRVSFSLSG